MLVTGAGGLVGSALVAAGGVVGLDRAALDVTDPEAVARALDRWRPAAVINAAAQAGVDRAEREPERTFAVNAEAPGRLARLCRERGVALVHLSTDYVLDGPDRPGLRLDEDTPPRPRSTYARSKLAGERAALAEGATVVRVQWVYALDRPGFLRRSLLAMRRGEAVRLVTDQVGSPTPATVVARALLRVAADPRPGLFHLACGGETTAWGWVEAAAERLGVPFRARPVTRAELGGAWRPARSCLDTARFARTWGEPPPRWEAALAAEAERVRAAGWPDAAGLRSRGR